MVHGTDVATPEKLTEENFGAWQEANQEAAAIAEKPEGERTEQETEVYDQFVEEIRALIPGADQLSAEQIRGLANNLEMGNTRHGGGLINSLATASSYTAGAMGIEGGEHVPDGETVSPKDTPASARPAPGKDGQSL